MRIFGGPERRVSIRVVGHLVMFSALAMMAAFAAARSTAAGKAVHTMKPAGGGAVVAAPSDSTSQPDFGANVYIFTPSMPQSEIQATVDSIASQQVSNQFGTQRYALLFAPGTYGSSDSPLNFQVGYYTMVAGLGLSPNDVVINGSIYVHNQCFGTNNCTALALRFRDFHSTSFARLN